MHALLDSELERISKHTSKKCVSFKGLQRIINSPAFVTRKYSNEYQI